MNITTKTGFTATVPEDVLDDIELLEDLVKLDAKDLTVIPRVIAALVGDEGKAALYEHCRGENGRVKMTEVVEEVADIINGLKDGKK